MGAAPLASRVMAPLAVVLILALAGLTTVRSAAQTWSTAPLLLPSPTYLTDQVFFFNDAAAAEIYSLSLHVPLPIPVSASSVVYTVVVPSFSTKWRLPVAL